MLAALLLLALSSPAAAEDITSAGWLLAHREDADGKLHCVVGTPKDVAEKYGEKTGKHLFHAKLDDGTGVISLWAYGFFPKVAEGERIEACGRFRKVRMSVANRSYVNELTVMALLKGRAIGTNAVAIRGDQVVNLAQRR